MKRIAILTSGGDSPSMNKTINSLVKFAYNKGIEVFLVYGGYKGLYEENLKIADLEETRLWANLPGTKIFSSRFKEFQDESIREKCIDVLKKNEIDVLVVIGGDGSYMGAYKLSLQGFPVICLPGTIDNDIGSSEYTIGFDSSLNEIVDRINEIKSCMQSHSDIAFVEIMGRHCVDLTTFAGIATDADIVLTYETFMSPQKVLDKIKQIREIRPTGSIMVLVTELLLGYDKKPSLQDYKNFIESNSSDKVKLNVLGYMQRGAKPSAMDTLRATLMARKAIDLVSKNRFNKAIGIKNGFDAVDYDIKRAIKMKNPLRRNLIKRTII